MQGWTGGWDNRLAWIPPDTYVVEIVDSAGNSWGKSAPLPIPAGGGPYNPTGQSPGVVFINFDGQTGSWNIDPATQDADTATDEITVTNLLGENVVVERCTIVDGERTSCTPVGTVAPQADLRTVETTVASSKADHPGLFIHLASDASQSYQRDLVQGGGDSRFHLPDRADPRPRHARDPRVQPDGHQGVRDVHLLRVQQRGPAVNAVGC